MNKAIKKLRKLLDEIADSHQSHFIGNKRECELLEIWLKEDGFKSKYDLDIKKINHFKADGPFQCAS